MSTYRELIQDIIAQLDQAYDKCGALRDAAVGAEKEPFNFARGQIGEAMRKFHTLDNSLSDKRASMVLPWKLPDWK